jgi:hypothetical protein
MKILIITANPHNNVSAYRASVPLFKLGIDIHYLWNDFKTESLKEFDAVIVTQAYAESHIYIAEKCKEYGVKVWLDYDDLLLGVSVWHSSTYHIFNKPEIAVNIKKLMGLADFITFSTNYLQQYFNVENSFVLPNAFDTETFSSPSNAGTEKEVMHRGSESHNLDLWTYRDPILKALNNSDYIPHFVGINPIYINMELQGRWTNHMSPYEYKLWLENTCNSKIQIVPLKDSKFNYSKSNCAWMEGTYAGCAVIAPNWEEWRKPGIINYNNLNDFCEKLKGMMSGRINLEDKMLRSREFINNNLTLKKVNEKRIDIITKYIPL